MAIVSLTFSGLDLGIGAGTFCALTAVASSNDLPRFTVFTPSSQSKSNWLLLLMCILSWTPHSRLEKDNPLNHSCVSPSLGCLEYT